MLTYDLTTTPKGELYETLYKYIRDDIAAGRFKAGEKLPSKRTLAKNLGISTITVECAYAQLTSEGYVYSLPKRGYYIANLNTAPHRPTAVTNADIILPTTRPCYRIDFSNNQTNPAHFPFATWKKLLREVIAEESQALMEKSPSGGVYALRQAIAEHLRAFRGMNVEPDQIIVGAGTEYLYGLLIQLFGRERIYCTENPGYRKIAQIYRAQGVTCRFAGMDENGIRVADLRKTCADIAHVGPTHQFPTGITMPVSRRYELLAWASEKPDRAIIEDDYDSEFRLHGKPIPALQSLDASASVVYMNTFTKSLASTIRISYMVLPVTLANAFYERLSFYACTVSNFEQFTLARFLSEGYFEKHINRMRLFYARRRQQVLDAIAQSPLADRCTIIEQDSGLHFLLELDTQRTDRTLSDCLAKEGIHLSPLSDYYETGAPTASHRFLLSYANLDMTQLPDALATIARLL
ncbi:MAG: PLP-dependent aminotransferase family protein [Peptococcaceae bacterium]|nr:PLP-dependent aminotransferase family protein [Peptococcaceae bacterium]